MIFFQNFWLPFHIGLSFLSEIMLILALGAGLLYLIQESRLKKKILMNISKLPALETLDQLQVRFLIIGFSSLTLGIFIGILGASQKWGWGWIIQPQQLWMFFGWGIYFILLKARLKTGFRGRRSAWASLMGLILVLFSGWHGYKGWF